MIQPLLSLAEARDELAASERDLERTLNATGVVDPARWAERIAVQERWVERQRAQVAEMEAM